MYDKYYLKSLMMLSFVVSNLMNLSEKIETLRAKITERTTYIVIIIFSQCWAARSFCSPMKREMKADWDTIAPWQRMMLRKTAMLMMPAQPLAVVEKVAEINYASNWGELVVIFSKVTYLQLWNSSQHADGLIRERS